TILDTCTRAVPSVSLSPGQSSLGPGGRASLTVSVTNNNGASCAASSFSLEPVVPTGWTIAASPGPMTLGSGASGSATVEVSAAASAVAGAYPISVTVTDSSTPLNRASASA